MHNEQNNFDWPSWTDIKNKATEALGTVTGNPVMTTSSQNAQTVNEILKKEGKPGTVTAQDVAPEGSGIDIKFLGPLKWILLAIFIVVLIAVFYRISGK